MIRLAIRDRNARCLGRVFYNQRHDPDFTERVDDR